MENFENRDIDSTFWRRVAKRLVKEINRKLPIYSFLIGAGLISLSNADFVSPAVREISRFAGFGLLGLAIVIEASRTKN